MHRERERERIESIKIALHLLFSLTFLFSFLALKCEMKSRKAARNIKRQYILHLAKIKKGKHYC